MLKYGYMRLCMHICAYICIYLHMCCVCGMYRYCLCMCRTTSSDRSFAARRLLAPRLTGPPELVMLKPDLHACVLLLFYVCLRQYYIDRIKLISFGPARACPKQLCHSFGCALACSLPGTSLAFNRCAHSAGLLS